MDSQESGLTAGAAARAEFFVAFPPDPECRVRTALREGFIQRVSNLLDLFPSQHSLTDLLRVLPEFARLTAEAHELSRWALDPLSEEEWRRLPAALGDLLTRQGWTYSEAQGVVGSIRRPRGCPPRMRVIAIKALEMKLRPGQSWMKITNRLCNCGAARHTESCKERIRQATMDLQEVLDRYGILPR